MVIFLEVHNMRFSKETIRTTGTESVHFINKIVPFDHNPNNSFFFFFQLLYSSY